VSTKTFLAAVDFSLMVHLSFRQFSC